MSDTSEAKATISDAITTAFKTGAYVVHCDRTWKGDGVRIEVTTNKWLYTYDFKDGELVEERRIAQPGGIRRSI